MRVQRLASPHIFPHQILFSLQKRWPPQVIVKNQTTCRCDLAASTCGVCRFWTAMTAAAGGGGGYSSCRRVRFCPLFLCFPPHRDYGAVFQTRLVKVKPPAPLLPHRSRGWSVNKNEIRLIFKTLHEIQPHSRKSKAFIGFANTSWLIVGGRVLSGQNVFFFFKKTLECRQD